MLDLDALRAVTLFSQLPDATLQRLADALERQAHPADTLLFRLGDPGDDFLIVESGSVAIFAPAAQVAEESVIRVFRAGESFGEMALIDQRPRTLSARTQEPTTLLALSGSRFHELIRESPELATAVMVGLSDRVRYMTEFLGQVRHWVRQVAESRYDGTFRPTEEAPKDQTLAALAADFAQMASTVQRREEALRREIAELQIEINEQKKQQDLSTIMSSDFFKNLQAKARSMRQDDPEEE